MPDGSCVRCGEVVEWGPPRKGVWVHRNPDDCIRYTKEEARRRIEELEREVLVLKAST